MGKKNFPYFEVEISKNYPSGISTHTDWKPSTNIVETRDSLVIEMELPGVAKEDISITMINDQELIIKGFKKQPRLDPVTYYLFEREFGAFFKKIVIDFPLETSTVRSLMENGVLTIQVRKRTESKIDVEIR